MADEQKALRVDYETLAFAGNAPAIDERGRTWRGMLQEANEIMALLPEDHV